MLYIPRIGGKDLETLGNESGMGTRRDCVDLKSGEPVDVWSQGLVGLENFPTLGGLPGSVHR